MIKISNYRYLFTSVLVCTVFVLLFLSQTLSISYKEALNVFFNYSILSFISKFSIYIFGQNDFALRVPFLIFYVLSVIFMFKITKNYFKYEKDRYISIFIYMFLPGVLSASLLVNSAILVTFFITLYIYYYQKYNSHSLFLLLSFLLIDNSFAILYLAIFLHSLKLNDKKMLYISAILFILSMYIYGFTTNGKPKGYLLDTFAIYASIFSPFLFFYFVYSIYRAFLRRDERTFIWYISATAFLISIVFSFRQKVYIENFAPYVVILLPYMVKKYLHSYRVRLKKFRKKHKVFAIIILLMLTLNVALTIANRTLYNVIQNPKKHFAYKYHFAKELSRHLKKHNINNIRCENKKLQLRLRFYNISYGNNYYLSQEKISDYDKKITIRYYGKDVLDFYVKKLK